MHPEVYAFGLAGSVDGNPQGSSPVSSGTSPRWHEGQRKRRIMLQVNGLSIEAVKRASSFVPASVKRIDRWAYRCLDALFREKTPGQVSSGAQR